MEPCSQAAGGFPNIAQYQLYSLVQKYLPIRFNQQNQRLMKTNSTHNLSFYGIKALRSLLFKRTIALAFVVMLPGVGPVTFGQQIMHVEDAISEMVASDVSEIFIQGMRLQSLVVDVHPSLYINKGELSAYGTGDPLVLYCDAISIQELYATNPLFSEVELIEISIDSSTQVPASISLEQMTGFLNLQYVYVKFGYDACGNLSTHCLAEILNRVFSDSTTPVVVLYGISVPE